MASGTMAGPRLRGAARFDHHYGSSWRSGKLQELIKSAPVTWPLQNPINILLFL